MVVLMINRFSAFHENHTHVIVIVVRGLNYRYVNTAGCMITLIFQLHSS